MSDEERSFPGGIAPDSPWDLVHRAREITSKCVSLQGAILRIQQTNRLPARVRARLVKAYGAIQYAKEYANKANAVLELLTPRREA